MKIPDFLARHFPHHETHKAAAPYALSSLGTAAVGITLTAMAAATALKVIGIMTTFLSLYAFGGVVFCALHHSHSADDFLENIHHYMVFSVGIAATSLIEQAVRSAWTSIVDLTSRR